MGHAIMVSANSRCRRPNTMPLTPSTRPMELQISAWVLPYVTNMNIRVQPKNQTDAKANIQFLISQHCSIAAGSSASPVGGMFANAFNGPQASAYESYTFSITPSGLPFPQCVGDPFKTNEQANVLQAIQAMCASDACTGPRDQYGCDKNITQASYVIRAHRQNYGTSDFSNCQAAMVRHQRILSVYFQKSSIADLLGRNPL